MTGTKAELLAARAATFPYPLPTISPNWRTTAVVGISTGIREAGAWDRLPVLADALDDAGCDDPDVLAHCRTHPHGAGKFPNRNGGCWEGTCWVVQAILQEPQRVAAEVSIRPADRVFVYVPVLNPGDNWQSDHTVYLIVPDTWSEGPLFAVEARNWVEAEDTLVEDDDFGKEFRLSDEELKDYMTDPGEWGENPRPTEYSCRFTGNGPDHPYDSGGWLTYDVASSYFGPGLPHEGVWPDRYAKDRLDCPICAREYVDVDDDEAETCGRPACVEAHRRVLAAVDGQGG